MAKTKQKNIILKQGQKIQLADNISIRYDGSVIKINGAPLEAVDSTNTATLSTRGYVDSKAGIEELSNDTTPQLGGDLDLNGHNINYTSILTVNGTYEGMIINVTVDDASVAFGNPLYCADDFNYERCDADTTATMPCVALAVETGAGSKMVLLEGQICNTTWDWSAGPIYISLTTGALTQTIPSGTGDQVQIVGFALSADTMYFRPDSTVVEIS